jgi:hypothetical protein
LSVALEGFAMDHDRLYKELLTAFFVEFLELFFPALAADLDRDSILISTCGLQWRRS